VKYGSVWANLWLIEGNRTKLLTDPFRVAVTPEGIGLCGCWQVIAVQRESLDLSQPGAQPTVEAGDYASSVTVNERPAAQMGKAIRGHWPAIENGTRDRRDVTFGEDANRTAKRHRAAVLASLRNLANGIDELARERGRTKVDTLRSWCQRQTFTRAWPLLPR